MKTKFSLLFVFLQLSADGITLKDICFSPLASESGPEDFSQCAVMSIWGYYQDDLDNMDLEDGEYLNRFMTCVKYVFILLTSFTVCYINTQMYLYIINLCIIFYCLQQSILT